MTGAVAAAAAGSTAPGPGIGVNIFNATAQQTVTDPTDATATYTLNSSGAGTRTGGAGWTWLTSGLNSDVEVRATLVTGTNPTSGTMATWQALSTTRSWANAVTVPGAKSTDILVEIRRVSDQVVIDSATITLSATVNSSSPVVDIFDADAVGNGVGGAEPSPADATYSLASSGTGSYTGGSNWTWLLSGLNSAYEVRATLVSGGLTSGSTGVWQALSTTRAWNLHRTASGSSACELTIEIRRASDSVVIDTATVTLTATVT